VLRGNCIDNTEHLSLFYGCHSVYLRPSRHSVGMIALTCTIT